MLRKATLFLGASQFWGNDERSGGVGAGGARPKPPRHSLSRLQGKIHLLFLILPIILAACAGGKPRLAVEVESFDFGEVVNGDVVTRDLEVRNEGTAPLVVEAVTTSCGCTRATLDTMTIPAGGRATLHIEYDSGAHGPEETGKITRQIFIATNDPQRPEVVVTFESTVLPRAGS